MGALRLTTQQEIAHFWHWGIYLGGTRCVVEILLTPLYDDSYDD